MIVAFFRIFLFTHIFPTLIISNAGLGTEAEKVEILSPLFFSTPRNSLVIPKFALIFIVRVVGDGYFYFCS